MDKDVLPASLCLGLKRLHKATAEQVYQQVRRLLQDVSLDVGDVCAWVADGCAVNGVQDDRDETGENVFAKLAGGSPELLRILCAPHRAHLGLEDVWKGESLKEFLDELDGLLSAMAAALAAFRPFGGIFLPLWRTAWRAKTEEARSRNSCICFIQRVIQSGGSWPH